MTKDADKKAKNEDKKIVEIPQDELDKIRSEAAEFKDKYLRLYAEFENTRKRFDREKSEFVKYANAELLTDFLNVLDDLERSVAAASEKHQDYDAFLKGIEMVMARTYEMLKRNGVEPIEAKGKRFDPNCHEILMQEETSEHEDCAVLEEFQKGYRIGDRVIRTAKVKVAQRVDSEEQDASQQVSEDSQNTSQKESQ